MSDQNNRMGISLIFSLPERLVGAVTARFLDHLPLDGILAEGLIAYPLAYLCPKRVVVMSHNPDQEKAIWETKLAIKEFDLHYAVFSDRYILDWDEGYPIIAYIKTFNLIKTVREDGDRYYVYEIPITKPA